MWDSQKGPEELCSSTEKPGLKQRLVCECIGEKGVIVKLIGMITLYIITENIIILDTITYHYTNLTITLHKDESTLQRGKVD